MKQFLQNPYQNVAIFIVCVRFLHHKITLLLLTLLFFSNNGGYRNHQIAYVKVTRNFPDLILLY